ncbi:peptidylprolyl isomerase [Kineobactrum salinum]|uniref:Dienelactone hydrolase n=1 Tax=Kineobactrum salinum TaxID=2708301 RepID=A0A6C0U4N9_9GAMM|nr:peptidylprolyl isomerase [Kineobactrum salinum]QIB66389.1 dienelactone hydrolase [Kineobactrum salinum]
MLFLDSVLGLALLVFVLSWWATRWRWRRPVLLGAALIGLAAAALGWLDYRWQSAPGAAVALLALLVAIVGALRRAPPRAGRPWLSGTLWLLLTAVAVLPLYLFPVRDLPAPSGAHPVGSAEFALIDESRRGLLGAAADEPRRLLIRVWYPASTVAGLEPRPYFSELEAATTATGLGRVIGVPFLLQYLKHVSTHAYPAAPVLDAADALPVVIYSHGYTSFAGQNSALMEELASHGYLVFAVQHSYDASPTVLPDGEVLAMDPALIETMRAAMEPTPAFIQAVASHDLAERRAGQIQLREQALARDDRIATISAAAWLEDRRFVLDALQQAAVPAAVQALVRAGDYRRTGQMGMSFGGSATGALCMVDSRCAAAVNLDGANFHETPLGANIPVPFLMLYSDPAYLAQAVSPGSDAPRRGFNEFSYERPELAGLRPDVYRFIVSRVRHLGLSDLTLFMRNPARAQLLGSIDAGAALQIQNDFVRGFFDTHLRNQEVDFPQAQLAQHTQWVTRERIDDVREWWLEQHPGDRTERVILETTLGLIELALYPRRAPLSTANFLAYVEAGHYDGATLYRVTNTTLEHGIDVVQGGLMGEVIISDIGAYERAEAPLPRVAHETTERTGIPNERATLAFARLEPGTATSEFFFNIQDNPGLDTGEASRNPDGQGYATFGRVLRGLPLLERIQALPTREAAPIPMLERQLLERPVVITRAYRVAEG